jgi:hypothetical protein
MGAEYDELPESGSELRETGVNRWQNSVFQRLWQLKSMVAPQAAPIGDLQAHAVEMPVFIGLQDGY